MLKVNVYYHAYVISPVHEKYFHRLKDNINQNCMISR